MMFSASTTVTSWEIGCLLRITGDDAPNFLQGQFTNDLRELNAGRGVYGLWLNQKGKVQGDSFVLRGEDARAFWVVSYFAAAPELKKRLEDYIIADDVVVEDVTSAWTGISLVGAEAGAWLARERRPGLIFAGRRARRDSWEWIFPKEDAGAVRSAWAGAPEVDGDELKRRRIREGIPAVPADIGPGDLPAEGGLETEAISYTKGCYLGQEVMARLKAMGQVRRRLMRVRGEGAAPVAPGKLVQEGKAVGELRSVVADGGGFLGLAMMSLVNLRNDRSFFLDGATPTALELLPETP